MIERIFREFDREVPPTVSEEDENGDQDVLAPGVRVRICIKDAFYGRTGVITSRHGRLFWNVRLDKTPQEPMSRGIYKNDSSLCVVP